MVIPMSDNGDLNLKTTEGQIENAWMVYSTKKRDMKAAKKYFELVRKAAKFLKTPPSSDDDK